MPKSNVLTRGKKKQAALLLSQGLLQQAKNIYDSVCQIDKTDTEAWIALAIVNRKLRQYDASETASRHAVALQPKNSRAHQALGAAIQCKGDLAAALSSYRTAIQLDPDNVEAHYFLGNALRELGSMGDAANAYRSAIRLRPDFIEALSNLGAALLNIGDIPGATEALNRAVILQPESQQVLCNLGHVLQRDGRLSESLAYYERALQLHPECVEALSSAATLYEKTYRLEEARKLLEIGLRLAPEDISLQLVAAKLARRDGQFNEAISRLENLVNRPLTPDIGGAAHMLLGQLYDRAGQGARAFTHIEKGNQLNALVSLPDPEAKNRYKETVRASGEHLEPALAATRRPIGNPYRHANPVFLVGFPRSGTTLLEQVLDAHPNVQGLEEKPTVQAMYLEFRRLAQGRAKPLLSLNDEEIFALQKSYFEELDRHIQVGPGVVVIDKMPLNTVHVPLIWRVFPDAKFIFAVRHPCDVCLSCLMQNFGINDAMANFFTLQDTVDVYSDVMDLWIRCTNQLPLHYHRVRYEDLIANVETEARNLFDFLGLPWSDAVLQHTEHARNRGTINTPSYHQVTQPIYQHAKFRWLRYREQFEPYLERLEPFITYFEYVGESVSGPALLGRTHSSQA